MLESKIHTGRQKQAKEEVGFFVGCVKLSGEILGLLHALRRGEKSLGLKPLSGIFIPAFISGFEKTLALEAAAKINSSLQTVQEIFAKLVVDTDQPSFSKIYRGTLRKEQKKMIRSQKSLKKGMSNEEFAVLLSTLHSRMSVKRPFNTKSGTSFVKFLEKINPGKKGAPIAVLEIHYLSSYLTAANKTFAVAVDYAGIMAGITFGKFINQYITVTPVNKNMATLLMKGLLEYLALSSEIANLKELRKNAFSYGIYAPMILGCLQGIYTEIAKHYPETLTQIKPEIPPPIISGNGFFARFINSFSPFVDDFRKAYKSAAATYDPYSKIFYNLDLKEREKLLDKLVHDEKIGVYRRAALEFLVSSGYKSIPTAATLSTLKYLSTTKEFFYNFVFEGGKAAASSTVSVVSSLARSLVPLFSFVEKKGKPKTEVSDEKKKTGELSKK